MANFTKSDIQWLLRNNAYKREIWFEIQLTKEYFLSFTILKKDNQIFYISRLETTNNSINEDDKIIMLFGSSLKTVCKAMICYLVERIEKYDYKKLIKIILSHIKFEEFK